MGEDATVGKLFDKLDELARQLNCLLGKMAEKEKSCERQDIRMTNLENRVDKIESLIDKEDGAKKQAKVDNDRDTWIIGLVITGVNIFFNIGHAKGWW